MPWLWSRCLSLPAASQDVMEQLVLVYCLDSLGEIRLASPHSPDLFFPYTIELGLLLLITGIYHLSCLALHLILVFFNSKRLLLLDLFKQRFHINFRISLNFDFFLFIFWYFDLRSSSFLFASIWRCFNGNGLFCFLVCFLRQAIKNILASDSSALVYLWLLRIIVVDWIKVIVRVWLLGGKADAWDSG